MGIGELLGFIPSEIVYRPTVNVLAFFMRLFHHQLGRAIIALTILIRIILLPSSRAGNALQKNMATLQPRIDEIKQQYAGDQEKIAQETIKLFQGNKGGSPLQGCIGMLVQIPIIYGLFSVINNVARKSGGIEYESLYSFLPKQVSTALSPETMDALFAHMNLLQNGQTNGIAGIILAILVGGTFYLQMHLTQLVKPPQKGAGALDAMSKIASKTTPMPDVARMMKMSGPLFAGMMGIFTYSAPTALGLYFAISTLFALTQFIRQYRVVLRATLLSNMGTRTKKTTKKSDGTTVIDISES